MSCETISVRKVDYYVNNPFARIIDIRDQSEYRKSHIKNAVNIPYELMIEYFSENTGHYYNQIKKEKYQKYHDILKDKSKIYVIYCDRGAMSMVICNKMSGLGYITKTVVGGFSKYNGRYIL